MPEVVPRARQGRRGGGDTARSVPVAHGPVGERRVGADARRTGVIHTGQPLPGAALSPERRGPQPLCEVAVLLHHQCRIPDGGRLYAGNRAGGLACVCCARSGGVNRSDPRGGDSCVYYKSVNMESTVTSVKHYVGFLQNRSCRTLRIITQSKLLPLRNAMRSVSPLHPLQKVLLDHT